MPSSQQLSSTALFSLLFALLALLPCATVRAGHQDLFLALGTSSTSGVYFPVGQAICEQINKDRDQHRVRCLAYATGGSIFNIQALAAGELDLAITRADLAVAALRGEGEFAGQGPNSSLRAVAALYDNPLAVIVKQDSDIATLNDLPGHRLNIGNLGSGKRAAADSLLAVMGWSRNDFTEVREYSTKKMGDAFCEDRLDVLVQMMGVPAPFYDRILGECEGRFLPLPAPVIDRLLALAPAFRRTTIPADAAPNTPASVPTVGSRAVLVASARTSAASIAVVVQALLQHFAAFQAAHPALNSMQPQDMMTPFGVPFHAGARQGCRAAGLADLTCP